MNWWGCTAVVAVHAGDSSDAGGGRACGGPGTGDRITIVVTHRLENTRIADHIVVMEQGRITEQGRYDDLTHAGGTFAELLALSQDR